MGIGRPKFQADNTISLGENREFKKQMREATRDGRAKISDFTKQALSFMSREWRNKNKQKLSQLGLTEVDFQNLLKKAGYYKGAIDGVAGKGTQIAYINFQKQAGIAKAGSLDGKVDRKAIRYLQKISNTPSKNSRNIGKSLAKKPKKERKEKTSFQKRIEEIRQANKQKIAELKAAHKKRMVERQEKRKKLKKSRNTKTRKSPEQETRKDTQKQQILKAKKQETSSNGNYLGSLSAKYESSKKGPYAYNPNDNGHGPSYGTYQMNTRVGVYKAFIRRHGISPGRKGWNAAIKKYGAKRFRSMEHAFIKEKNYDPMMRRITIKNKSRFSNAMKQVIWSVAVQHGGGHKNLISIINRSGVIPGNTASEAQLIKSIYHQRSKIWPAGVKIRYTQERKTALALVKSGSSIA